VAHRVRFSRFIPALVTLGIVIALISAPILGQSPAEAAKDGNGVNAKRCQKDGWQQLMTSDGIPFSSQDECVDAGANGAAIVPLVPTQLPPTDVPAPPTETPAPPTETPVPPTDTPVPPTEVPTETPSPIPTDTPSPTATETVAPTETPIPTATPTETFTPTATPSPTAAPQPSIQVIFAAISGRPDECLIGAVLRNFQPSTYYDSVDFWLHNPARTDFNLMSWGATTDASGTATVAPKGTSVYKTLGYTVQVRVGSVMSPWVPIDGSSC